MSADPAASSSSSAQATVSKSCTEKPMSAAWAAMSVATSIWAIRCSTGTRPGDCRVRAPPNRRLAPPGPVPSLPLRDGAAPEVRGVGVSRPLTLACVGEPILGELPYRFVQAYASWSRSDRPRRATCVRGSRGAAIHRSRRHRRRPHTCSTGRTTGEHRRRAKQCPFVVVSRWYDHSTAWRNVSWRSGPGSPRCNGRNRSASRSLTLIALIAAMRAAASSMPGGRPSTVSQISTTAVAVCGSWSSKSWRAERARSTNRVTASEVAPPGRQRRHCHDRLSGHADGLTRGSQDLRVPGSPEDPSIAAATEPLMCSQLSTTSNIRRPTTVSATVSISGTSLCVVMPSTVARAAGTAPGSPTPASSTIRTPSSNSPASSAPTSMAETSLADATDAGQRYQTLVAHQFGDIVDIAVAPDEASELT